MVTWSQIWSSMNDGKVALAAMVRFITGSKIRHSAKLVFWYDGTPWSAAATPCSISAFMVGYDMSEPSKRMPEVWVISWAKVILSMLGPFGQ